jgi:hypothetical protein
VSHDILFRWLVLRMLSLILRALYNRPAFVGDVEAVLHRATLEAEVLRCGDLSAAPGPITTSEAGG